MTESAATFRTLLDTFGTGWERGDAEAVCSIFAPDAVFIETPFSTPDRGLPAIRAYWSEVPANQAEVSFKSGEIYAAGPWFATEFRCTFRRRRTGERIEARGAIFCETSDGKVTEMRMYWHRYAGGREEPKP
jgi:ketosteroid isomerase-like protein